MSRLTVIQLAQLPAFAILEALDVEAILSARMNRLVEVWATHDPPAAAQYDVQGLEFDPIKINQEVGSYFELLIRDRINQAARGVTLAFAVGDDLDVIASRYPGGVPRLEGESDDHYRARIWLSPNLLSPNGSYEAYVFWGMTADPTLRDVSATAVTGTPDVTVALLADGDPVRAVWGRDTWVLSPFPNPTPTIGQITHVRNYINQHARKALTDVVQVVVPKIVDVDYEISYWLYPGWDETQIRQVMFEAFAQLVESQRYLGFSYTEAAIEAVLKIAGVSNVKVDVPVSAIDPDDHDIIVASDTVVRVNSVEMTFRGRMGIQAFDDTEE